MIPARATLAILAPLVFVATACAGTAEPATNHSEAAQTGKDGPATVLVSDIDDTIKETGVHSGAHVIAGAASTLDEFAGMSMLYARWHQAATTTKKITYLTAAPGALDTLGIQFLQAARFPGDTADVAASVVSGRSTREASGDFKARKLEEYYDALKTKPKTMILVGDNGEQDILAYGAFEDYVRKQGGQTAIYSFIHAVYEAPDKALPITSPHTAFLTSADLAVQFFDHGWIDEPTLDAVLDEVEYDSAPSGDLTDTVVPSFMECASFDAWPALVGASSATASKYAAIVRNVKVLCTTK
jgi:hypothetical protein